MILPGCVSNGPAVCIHGVLVSKSKKNKGCNPQADETRAKFFLSLGNPGGWVIQKYPAV